MQWSSFYFSIATVLNPWQLKSKKAGAESPTRSFYGGLRPNKKYNILFGK
jgi:hypothetical protein